MKLPPQSSPVILEGVAMNTVMLIIKAMGTIKVNLQRYKQRSNSVLASILKVQLRAGLGEGGEEAWGHGRALVQLSKTWGQNPVNSAVSTWGLCPFSSHAFQSAEKEFC